MASTIEGTHRQILGKFTEALNRVDNPITREELQQLKKHYVMATAPALQTYYAAVTPTPTVTLEYYRIITTEDYTGRINAIAVGNMSADDMKFVQDIKIHIYLEKRSDDICATCGKQMEVLDETSEYRCGSCNLLAPIEGMVFHDSQCYAQEGSKKRTNDYNARKHGEKWLSRIQGIEHKDINPDMMKRIRTAVSNDNVKTYQLNVDFMRELFKDPRVAATSLNPHCSLLIRMLGGTPPPTLSLSENEFILTKYCIVVSIYFEVCVDGKNTPYCPYFMYKIIRVFFAEKPHILKLLNYIHLQSEDTLTKHDIEYGKICARANPADGFKYMPTDTSEKF